MSERDEELAKIWVDVPYRTATVPEAVWARPLGDDLYELENIPLARGLHYRDGVRAVPQAEGDLPKAVEVVRRGGHKTLLVTFSPEAGEAEVADMLRRLERWGASRERFHGRFYGIDVGPDGDFDEVLFQLDEWEQEGLLHFQVNLTREEIDQLTA
jgi:Domain of unknown function (DUF4265)